ncbi:DUF4134 domain-containing protein [Pedobacter aquatilis]|uniref:DUF4134 domain-containing protein n=1 Tax=Pedobacter aquatilis TaxID=351343 RepID=UPI00292DE113|nr:DUF4134 domain-containing protein [Pedobacter aquatilis]
MMSRYLKFRGRGLGRRELDTGYFSIGFWGSLIGVLVLMLGVFFSGFAQNGQAGIQEATNQVRSYFATGTNLMYAIGAVMGIIGAVKVYQKWNAGEPDTGKVAAAWFGSCVFLVIVTSVLKSFFGV